MLTLYVVRHGNTENNLKSMTMGQIDTPLTKQGLKDAAIIAKKIAKLTHAHRVANIMVDEDLERIYSSDLGRAFITAHIIAEKVGLENRLLPAKELREINNGKYANRDKEEVRQECP